MGNSHKNLPFRNHSANCNQTLVEWPLDGPLSKICPVIPTSNQEVRQAKKRKRGDEIKKKNLI
jgi:myo-inositol catabolism protein IolC